MYKECVCQWDQIEEHWDIFEQNGLNPRVISQVSTALNGPLAIVGCGRGLMLEHFVKSIEADEVWGFDTSANMVENAKQRGFANVVLVSPETPIPESLSFETIIISTGVLDVLHPTEIVALLTTLKKRLNAGGVLVVAAFAKQGEAFEFAQILGADCDLGISNQRIFQLYREYLTVGDWQQVLAALTDPAKQAIAIGGMSQMDKKFRRLADKKNWQIATMMDWFSKVAPQVERLFALSELVQCTEEAQLQVTEQITLAEDNLHLLICQ